MSIAGGIASDGRLVKDESFTRGRRGSSHLSFFMCAYLVFAFVRRNPSRGDAIGRSSRVERVAQRRPRRVEGVSSRSRAGGALRPTRALDCIAPWPPSPPWGFPRSAPARSTSLLSAPSGTGLQKGPNGCCQPLFSDGLCSPSDNSIDNIWRAPSPLPPLDS